MCTSSACSRMKCFNHIKLFLLWFPYWSLEEVSLSLPCEQQLNSAEATKIQTSDQWSFSRGGSIDQWESRTYWRWFTFLTSVTKLPSIHCVVITVMHSLCFYILFVCVRVCVHFHFSLDSSSRRAGRQTQQVRIKTSRRENKTSVFFLVLFVINASDSCSLRQLSPLLRPLTRRQSLNNVFPGFK